VEALRFGGDSEFRPQVKAAGHMNRGSKTIQ